MNGDEIVSRWGKIKRPTSVCSSESKKEMGGYECEPEKLVHFYDKHNKCFFSVARMIFKVTLIPDKNLYIILAGSMAGLPLNIITGKSISDCCLFAAQLFFSLLFYCSFLRFVLIVNRVREKSAGFDAGGCGVSLIPQAKRNIEFAACWTAYEKIKFWFFLSLAFFVVTIVLVFVGG